MKNTPTRAPILFKDLTGAKVQFWAFQILFDTERVAPMTVLCHTEGDTRRLATLLLDHYRGQAEQRPNLLTSAPSEVVECGLIEVPVMDLVSGRFYHGKVSDVIGDLEYLTTLSPLR